MFQEKNLSGKPLANPKWLEKHHRAKLQERFEYAKTLLDLHPKSIVDLGCATGLWLEIFNNIAPKNCKFIGIDIDDESLSIAKKRSKHWNREIEFIKLDIEKDCKKIPICDLTLAFNIFPYINNLNKFINTLANRTPHGYLAIRQYDGASIRFGPMSTDKRQQIETELRLGIEESQKFKHYDMDRTFEAISHSSYTILECQFELFKRFSPFDNNFIPYYDGTIEWTCDHITKINAKFLQDWLKNTEKNNRYFFEIDLVALLSSS